MTIEKILESYENGNTTEAKNDFLALSYSEKLTFILTTFENYAQETEVRFLQGILMHLL